MRNLDFAMRIVSEGVADMEDRGFKVVPANAREAVAYVFGATEAVGSPDKIINSTAKVKQITKRVEEILSKGRMKKNPRSSRGVYATFDSWRAAAKKAGAVRFEGGRDDIAQAWDATGSWVGEWDGAEGFVNKPKTKENPVRPRRGESERDFISRCMSEEKKKFPEPKQRIAVCLSKARRNPFPDRNLDE